MKTHTHTHSRDGGNGLWFYLLFLARALQPHIIVSHFIYCCCYYCDFIKSFVRNTNLGVIWLARKSMRIENGGGKMQKEKCWEFFFFYRRRRCRLCEYVLKKERTCPQTYAQTFFSFEVHCNLWIYRSVARARDHIHIHRDTHTRSVFHSLHRR